MGGSVNFHSEFFQRVRSIPCQGLGLSVEVYSPDLLELIGGLKARGLVPGYLEIFKATTSALEAIRQQLPSLTFTYHGEGLWVTQPESHDQPVFDRQITEAALHQNVLRSLWLNHECATKQMAGYSFGTYLPPLYTSLSAAVVAENIGLVQATLDRQCRRAADGASPLFLLEIPPLTYFAAGTISIPKFFRLVTQQTSCGLVLDLGHLWTVYRYTDAWRTEPLERFVCNFLHEFPMERVVELHVAGLDLHEHAGVESVQQNAPVAWIDAHAAPIPSILWKMLEQVLQHPRLVNLRGVALEVDTKPIAVIVDEFDEASRRLAPLIQQAMSRAAMETPPPYERAKAVSVTSAGRAELSERYAHYARIVSGLEPPSGDEWAHTEPVGLRRYQMSYLPHEILHWGGDLTAMFPETCRSVMQRGILLADFVTFWFDRSRPVTAAYDFFLLKIERFLEFVADRAPQLSPDAEQEAQLLRRAYADANDVGATMMESMS